MPRESNTAVSSASCWPGSGAAFGPVGVAVAEEVEGDGTGQVREEPVLDA